MFPTLIATYPEKEWHIEEEPKVHLITQKTNQDELHSVKRRIKKCVVARSSEIYSGKRKLVGIQEQHPGLKTRRKN